MNTNTSTQSPSRSEVRLSKILDDYLAAIQRGVAPDRSALLAAHPDLAEDLNACLASLDFLRTASPVDRLDTDLGEDGSASRLLGDFRILREVGRGGMGVVYEADQISLGRRVALKVLPFAAALDSRQLKRFKTEAQAAAQLHHTNIVPVFWVGCEQGVHYYAMQFIEGRSLAEVIREMRQAEGKEPSDAAAREGEGPSEPANDMTAWEGEAPSQSTKPATSVRQTSSTRSRAHFHNIARLGIEAAEALEYAHQEGIIHRDIKPANLMIDAKGHLWITDFGLARLQSDSGLTMTGDVIGTLRYMSPEQALGRRVLIDARTDIYSLGVTLYELLTLQPAFESSDRQELLRQIADEEPRSPRKINASIPRELETIILKAMSKEAESRYATAQHVADDLRRFAEDKPIKAKRPSPAERAAKWSRRHRPLVGSSLAVLILAVIGLASATALIWSERTKSENAYQAEAAQRKLLGANLELALKVVDEIYLDVAEKHLQSRSPIAPEDQELLKKALAFYERFAAQNETSPGAQFAAAAAHGRAADILRVLGDHVKAKEEYDRAIAGLSRLPSELPAVASRRFRLAEVYGNLSLLLQHTGRPSEAVGALREALAILQKLAEEFPTEVTYRHRLAANLHDLSKLLADGGKLRQAGEAGRHAVGILETLVKEHPQDPKYGTSLSDAYNLLGVQAWTAGQNREAADAYRRALSVLVKSVGDNPSDAKSRSNLDEIYQNLSVVLGPDENAAKEDYVRRAVRLREQLAADFPNLPEHQHRLAHYYGWLAMLLDERGRGEQAEQAMLRAIEIREGLVKRYADVPEYQAFFGALLNNWGVTLQKHGKLREARGLFRRAVLCERAALKSHPVHPVWREHLRRQYESIVSVSVRLGEQGEAARAAEELAGTTPIQWQDQLKATRMFIGCFTRAKTDFNLSLLERESYAERALKLLHDLSGLVGSDTNALKDVAAHMADLEIARFRDPPEAVRLATKATNLAPMDPEGWAVLGLAQYRAGNWKAAIQAIEKAVQLGPAGDGGPWFLLAMANWKGGEKDRARQWYDKAVVWMEKNQPGNWVLTRWRAEAAVLMNLAVAEMPNGSEAFANVARQ